MRKSDLVKQLAEELDLTLELSTDVVNAVFDAIVAELLAGGDYHHSGFGNFSVAKRRKRRIHNVASGSYTTIPEMKAIRFLASRTLKRRLNAKRKSQRQ